MSGEMASQQGRLTCGRSIKAPSVKQKFDVSLLVGVLVLGLGGCGSDSVNPDSAPPASQTSTDGQASTESTASVTVQTSSEQAPTSSTASTTGSTQTGGGNIVNASYCTGSGQDELQSYLRETPYNWTCIRDLTSAYAADIGKCEVLVWWEPAPSSTLVIDTRGGSYGGVGSHDLDNTLELLQYALDKAEC